MKNCKHREHTDNLRASVLGNVGLLVHTRTCDDCNAQLPLGPAADDSPQVAIEQRAALLVSGGPSSERIDRIETPLERLGRKGKEFSTVIQPNPYYRPGMGRMIMRREPVNVESPEWQAGHLAACIAAHDKEQST